MKYRILHSAHVCILFLLCSTTNAATLLYEDFEDGVLDPRMSVQTLGTFVSNPGIKSFS